MKEEDIMEDDLESHADTKSKKIIRTVVAILLILLMVIGYLGLMRHM